MRFFLKKTERKKGTYLQIYISKYFPEIKGNRNNSYKTLGYVEDIKKSEGIEDPISYYQEEIKKMNKEFKKNEEVQIGETSTQKYLGYFLLKAVWDKLDVEKTLKIVTSNFKCPSFALVH